MQSMSELAHIGNIAYQRSDKCSSELLVLTYGVLVTQLMKDYEDISDVNREIENIGYNIGTRLIDEVLSKAELETTCSSFKEAVEVEFPKKDIFTVGSSKIGAESLKFIQNGALYQVFSVLIKTAMSAPTWEELYKKFMHPAGFFIGTRIVSDTEADAGIGLMPLAILDSSAGPTVTSEAVITLLSPFTQMTALLDSDGNGTNDFRVGLDQLVSVYQTLTATQLDKFYGSINTLIGVNSFKFDDSDIGDSAGASRPDFSLTTETMDNEMFSNYLIDSTF